MVLRHGLFLLTLLLIITRMAAVTEDIQIAAGFKRTDMCHLEDRFHQGLISTLVVKTQIDCAQLCLRDQKCHGFSFTRSDFQTVILSNIKFNTKVTCYIHKQYFTFEECVDHMIKNNDHVYFKKFGFCYNGGSWNIKLDRCICRTPADTDKRLHVYGKFCNDPMRNCEDMQMTDEIGDETLTKTIELTPVPGDDSKRIVRCRLNKTLIRVAMVKNVYNEKPRFNMPFESWEKGIGEYETGGEYWLGLKYIHGILLTTSLPAQMSVSLGYYKKTTRPTGGSSIYGVKVTNAADGYRLVFDSSSTSGTMSGMTSYCFLKANGIQFSAFDMDRDGNATTNCASVNKAGWWYNDCDSPCNVFGKFPSKPFKPYKPENVRVGDVRMADLNSEIFKINVFIYFNREL